MTRKEFFESRAKADFAKRHGVTKVAPAAALGALTAEEQMHRQGRGARSGNMSHARTRLHSHDKAGEPIPVQFNPFRYVSR